MMLVLLCERQDMKVVILIDDLDRCFPDQAIRLLESIKLVLAQPGFIFVLGVARKVVEGYLQRRYSIEYGIKDFKGELYLDKIVQLPFHIPRRPPVWLNSARPSLADQPLELTEELTPVLPAVAEALGGNPRAVIRFINNILVDYSISKTTSTEAATIPIRFFAISRCLEHRWPEIFHVLTFSDGLATAVVNCTSDEYAAKANGSENEALVASRLISDPELRRLLTGEQGREWLIDRALRDASVSFLVNQQRFSPLDTAEVQDRYDAFISFSIEDRREVLLLVDALTKAGARVFFDGHIRPGASFTQVLRHSLDVSKDLVYCVGRTSSTSQGQQNELIMVMSKANLPVIPVILPGANTDTDLPESLRDRQWVDLREGIIATAVANLAFALRGQRA